MPIVVVVMPGYIQEPGVATGVVPIWVGHTGDEGPPKSKAWSTVPQEDLAASCMGSTVARTQHKNFLKNYLFQSYRLEVGEKKKSREREEKREGETAKERWGNKGQGEREKETAWWVISWWITHLPDGWNGQGQASLKPGASSFTHISHLDNRIPNNWIISCCLSKAIGRDIDWKWYTLGISWYPNEMLVL